MISRILSRKAVSKAAQVLQNQGLKCFSASAVAPMSFGKVLPYALLRC